MKKELGWLEGSVSTRNVTITTHSGLLVDFARENDVKVVIRGLRAVSDFELELQMAHANKAMLPELETLFLMTETTNSFISSSMVREIAAFGRYFKMGSALRTRRVQKELGR
jgi:pantetheine-phosphate adenylyltransferase